MTTHDVWVCPICGQAPGDPAAIMAHGREKHPSVLPAHATIAQRLDLIAALADEAALTAGHPNPDGQQARARRPPSGRAPADLAALDLAAPPDDDHPERPLSLLVECSRLCWAATPLDVHQAHPQPDPPCTIASEARWLAGLWPAAQPWLDLADCYWIDDSTTRVLRLLAAATRTAPRPVHHCPSCGEVLADAAGGWLWCRACGAEHPGPERLAEQWRRKPPMATADIAATLGINPNRLHKWRFRGMLAPARVEAGIAYWRPLDVIALLWPDTLEAA